MEELRIDHKQERLNTALGFSKEDDDFIVQSLRDISRRQLREGNKYMISNALQDFITKVLLYLDEEIPDLHKSSKRDMLLIYLGYKWKSIEDEIAELQTKEVIEEMTSLFLRSMISKKTGKDDDFMRDLLNGLLK